MNPKSKERLSSKKGSMAYVNLERELGRIEFGEPRGYMQIISAVSSSDFTADAKSKDRPAALSEVLGLSTTAAIELRKLYETVLTPVRAQFDYTKEALSDITFLAHHSFGPELSLDLLSCSRNRQISDHSREEIGEMEGRKQQLAYELVRAVVDNIKVEIVDKPMIKMIIAYPIIIGMLNRPGSLNLEFSQKIIEQIRISEDSSILKRTIEMLSTEATALKLRRN